MFQCSRLEPILNSPKCVRRQIGNGRFSRDRCDLPRQAPISTIDPISLSKLQYLRGREQLSRHQHKRDIDRSSERNDFIKQAIDPCLFNSLSMFLLFAFDLQFAIASILFQRGLAPYAPLKFVDAAFAATLLIEPLKRIPSPPCQDARFSRSCPATIAKRGWSGPEAAWAGLAAPRATLVW